MTTPAAVGVMLLAGLVEVVLPAFIGYEVGGDSTTAWVTAGTSLVCIAAFGRLTRSPK